MSRTFDFSYEGLTRDAPYEAIFVDYKHSDFNFTVKKTDTGYLATCFFCDAILIDALEFPFFYSLSETDQALARVFIREKNEYMKSHEFKKVMYQYQIDLEQQLKEDRVATPLGGTSPRLFVTAPENVTQTAEAELLLEKPPHEDTPFKAQ
ncbi:MAG: hypothetical protein Q8L78_05230 [Coxiellaceae bacterium]|nr:hypothetical protein [Coxiellaceae bacterium]